MPNYTAPVEDMLFLFEKLRDNKNYNELEKYNEVSSDLVKDILEEAAKINQNLILPLAIAGDENPAKLENGVVRTPPGYKEAYSKYIEDGRAVILFDDSEDQLMAGERFRNRYSDQRSVAYTLTPDIPAWFRNFGIKPMSLGLDLRGGVYFLLEVDMDTAINTRLTLYQQSFNDLLREAKIRSRIEINGMDVQIRVRSQEDLSMAKNIVSEMDPELLILDGNDMSFRVRMTEDQIKARQDFAIEQNITTLRNRVNQLGVAEPLVQRQGLDRIVVQLPGVQDPNRLDDILTATATLEFHLVDNGGNNPGSRRYTGRPGVPSQVLRREIIASGDQIIDAESGFSQGQPAVFITLDAAGGESMLKTTRENLNKPMSTVFIETRRVTEETNGRTVRETKTN